MPQQPKRLPQPQVIDILEMAENAKTTNVKGSRDLLHPLYNFFTYTRSGYNLVSNRRYLNIFKNKIPDAIHYILSNIKSSDTWSEYYSVTDEMIEVSLKPSLLEAFNNIHDEGGFLIDRRNFYRTVYNAMVSDNLDNYDPDTYYRLAKGQYNDEMIEYIRSDNEVINQQAALGVASQSAIKVDPLSQPNENSRHAMERSKPLPEEVFANMLMVSVRENTEYNSPLKNSGISSTSIAQGNTFTEFGEGSNYYIFSKSIQHGDLPAPVKTAISDAYYVDSSANRKIMELLGGTSSHRWRVTNPSTTSEFASYNTDSTDSGPLFLKLKLTSIENQNDQVQNSVYLLNQQKATYKVITDEEEINTYTKNFGYQIQRVNIDYDDPFYVYLQNSGEVDLITQNLGFGAFDPRKGPNFEDFDQFLISTLPRGVIFVPGYGTKHNTFLRKSTLINSDSLGESTTVTRELMTRRSMKKRNISPQLDEKVVFDEFGTSYIGLMEKQSPDFDRVFFQYNADIDSFKKTYFVNGSYTSTPPTTRERSAEGKIVRVIEDVLKPKYNLKDNTLTFWDILRRIPYSTYIRLSSEDPADFMSAVQKGGWGVKVRDVLNRAVIEDFPGGETGILSERDADIDDPIIITKQDRDIVGVEPTGMIPGMPSGPIPDIID